NNLTFTGNANVTLGIAIDDEDHTGSGGAQVTSTTATIQYNVAPTLGGDDAITVVQGGTAVITTADLTATDPDNTTSELVYTVTATQHGHILLNGHETTSFTEQDIIDGHVAFEQIGSPIDDFFTVSLTDGIAAPQSATVNATVTAAPPPPPPTGSETLVGTDGDDTLTGHNGDDGIYEEGGNDRLDGRNGNGQ